jgi:hypothetical protein
VVVASWLENRRDALGCTKISCLVIRSRVSEQSNQDGGEKIGAFPELVRQFTIPLLEKSSGMPNAAKEERDVE